MKLQRGDIFTIHSESLLDKLIDWVQAMWAKDKKSTESHCGIIISEDGETFESKFRISRGHIAEYTMNPKKRVRIYRHAEMSEDKFIRGWDFVKIHEGQIYPIHRWPLFILGLAEEFKVIKKPVCSELTKKFLYGCDLALFYWGVDVDELSDEVTSGLPWEVIL